MRQDIRSLPDWFGIESAILDYVDAVKSMKTWCFEVDGSVVGFISIKEHNQYSAEVYVMGILNQHQNQEYGRSLLKIAEDYLMKKQFRYLTVITLSESHPDLNYAKTRQFYQKYGFLPLEEFKILRGEGNPCLFLAKSLNSVE